MIKVGELRVGNVLNYDTGEGIAPTTIGWQDIKLCEEDEDGFNKYHKPVDLSESVLMACGFDKKSEETDNFWLYKQLVNGMFFQTDESVGCRVVFIGHGSALEIKSLHRLQNLYHAMTGKELLYRP